MTTQNRLYYGDNLDVLRQYIASESVDLVYLDSPFNSHRNNVSQRKLYLGVGEGVATTWTQRDAIMPLWEMRETVNC